MTPTDGNIRFREGFVFKEMSKPAYDALMAINKDVNASIEGSSLNELIRLRYVDQSGKITEMGMYAVELGEKLLKAPVRKSPVKIINLCRR